MGNAHPVFFIDYVTQLRILVKPSAPLPLASLGLPPKCFAFRGNGLRAVFFREISSFSSKFHAPAPQDVGGVGIWGIRSSFFTRCPKDRGGKEQALMVSLRNISY